MTKESHSSEPKKGKRERKLNEYSSQHLLQPTLSLLSICYFFYVGASDALVWFCVVFSYLKFAKRPLDQNLNLAEIEICSLYH
jgi:hypothetical protein